MSRVVTAIIFRETKTRFGKNKLGYFWALIEPSGYIGILLFLRYKMHASIPFGENIYLFVLTGLLMYRLFISIADRCMSSISSNQSLLTYPLVKPIDTIIARIILEVMTMLVVILVFFGFLIFYTDYPVINYPLEFCAAIIATIFLGASVGVFNAVFSVVMPAWERVWGISKLPTLFLSGIFYMPRSMPPALQEIIKWNPLLHCVEWLRQGSYLDYDPLLSKNFVLVCSLFVITLGLAIERRYRSILVRQ